MTHINRPGIPGEISSDFNVVNFTTSDFYLVRIDPQSIAGGNVTLTLTGPSDVWFGAGFMDALPVYTPGTGGGSAMDNTWAVVVLGDGSVQERKLGHHAAGEELVPSVTVISNTVAANNGTRTVMVKRSLLGATVDHYTFRSAPDTASVGAINAVGSSAQFGYHKKHAASKLYYVDVEAPTCICNEAPPLGSTGAERCFLFIKIRK